ncbi:serine protease [Archangium lansingense]|uniref:Serine protease n=1 Tax=Archangium lansingense TaxID=2995310 RepID=A0ABT3ZYS4_9BACT|nr:serine protease [Archangium lansinium]MCY1074540.1 serine protease [Archangium lansinium]
MDEADAVGRMDQEIVGGIEARPHSFPWIVSLQQGASHFCGASIVRVGPKEESDIILTAAHCVADGISGVYAVAGAHDFYQPSSGQTSVRVARSVYHPAYDPDTTMNDIAVLKLERPIKFSGGGCGQTPVAPRPNSLSPGPQLSSGAAILPVCLPASGEMVPDNTEATVAGWGLTREGGYDTSSILMQVGVPTVNSRALASAYASQGILIDPLAMLGAGYSQGGKDACQGDSGGPLVMKSGSKYVLQGITSFGVGCARAGLPGVYTRVSNYIPWISTQIKSLSSVR